MSQFRNLVFEGGGVKGIAYAGAIYVLEEENILPDIKRVAGTSAGAITAALVAAGARGDDIATMVGGTSFSTFMDDSFLVFQDVWRLLKKYGWYKGNAFTAWLREHLQRLTGDADLTFGQLAQLRQGDPRRYRDLYVVGTNVSKRTSEIYSTDHTPDMPIWQAVRISMSLPLFFTAVLQGGEVKVDGGTTWNYPIDLFDDERFLGSDPSASVIPTRHEHDRHLYNKETLGFRVDTPAEIAARLGGGDPVAVEIHGIADMVRVLLGYLLDTANKTHLLEEDWHRTIFINAGGVSTTDFDLPQSKIEMLIENGRQGARDYLEWFNNPDETPMNRVL
jgi:NTE family protein